MNPAMDIDRLSESELLTLNRRIVQRLKLMQQARQNESMLKFDLGDRVSFDPDGRVRVGILSRYNKKTVTVITEEGQHWTVRRRCFASTWSMWRRSLPTWFGSRANGCTTV